MKFFSCPFMGNFYIFEFSNHIEQLYKKRKIKKKKNIMCKCTQQRMSPFLKNNVVLTQFQTQIKLHISVMNKVKDHKFIELLAKINDAEEVIT